MENINWRRQGRFIIKFVIEIWLFAIRENLSYRSIRRWNVANQILIFIQIIFF